MTKLTRRTVVGSGIAALASPGIVRAQARIPANRHIKAVFHGDVPTFDPIWTTANMAAYHGCMVYDTLFGVDAKHVPQPQMVNRWNLSDDMLTYTFELRDGLKWTDGTAVTTADVIPSLKRWAARDGAGQHLMLRVKDIAATALDVVIGSNRDGFNLFLGADNMFQCGTVFCCQMPMRHEDEADHVKP